MKRIKYAFTVIRIFMKNQIQDRTNLILDVFNMIARCFIVFLLYAYIFELNGGSINGVDYKTTMWSMFIYFCIMIFNVRRLDNIIMTDVRSGNVEMFMNKPTNYLTISFMNVIGKGIFSFLFISLFGTIIMAVAVGVPNLNLPIFIPTFCIVLILGQILGLLVYGIIGLMAFFIQDIRPIHWIVDKIVILILFVQRIIAFLNVLILIIRKYCPVFAGSCYSQKNLFASAVCLCPALFHIICPVCYHILLLW